MIPKQTAEALQPAAKANTDVIGVVKRLASQAQDVQDPKAREAMLQAANDLLEASGRITAALEKVSQAR